MSLRRAITCILTAGVVWLPTLSKADDTVSSGLHLELNSVRDAGTACRLTFVAQNQIGQDIDRAVFETVLFDNAGSVLFLSLFDFRDLPFGTPRVRQFDVPGTACSVLGRVLINDANTCMVDEVESGACASSLSVTSRIDLELLG